MKNTSKPSEAGGPTPPPGLTEPLAESGRLPGFMYRREDQCFVLTPDRHTKAELLGTVMVWGLAAGFLGKAAYIGAGMIGAGMIGAGMIGASWQGGHGSAVFGAALVLLGFVPGATILWITVADLCFGRRPSVLDRGRGEFRIGARVVCGLGDIALLCLHRGHNPDAPKNLRNARYFGSFVLRDGRQVPFGRSVGEYTSGKEPEAEMGDGIAGAKIEVVMQAVAAFLGVEYALTGGPDEGLRPRKGEGGM